MKNMVLLITFSITTTALAAEPCASIPNSTVEIDSATNKVKGCKLIKVEPNSAYAKLGFKAGDVVRPKSSGSTKSMELDNATKTQESSAQ
jgi:hypothetical protein